MKEKDFQNKFGRWLKANWHASAVFELKLVRGKSLPFSSVKEHQVWALMKAQNAKIYYKIPDCGNSQKPFDCFLLTKIPAYVVIMFYRRGQKEFIIIDINLFAQEQQRSKRKSLTEERAKEIGNVHYLGS